jgi:hypothetical protein
MVEELTESFETAIFLALIMLLPVGALYWIWMAIQLKSFAMFALGVAGPMVFLTAPIGAWSLVFGMPTWIGRFFG